MQESPGQLSSRGFTADQQPLQPQANGSEGQAGSRRPSAQFLLASDPAQGTLNSGTSSTRLQATPNVAPITPQLSIRGTRQGLPPMPHATPQGAGQQQQQDSVAAWLTGSHPLSLTQAQEKAQGSSGVATPVEQQGPALPWASLEEGAGGSQSSSRKGQSGWDAAQDPSRVHPLLHLPPSLLPALGPSLRQPPLASVPPPTQHYLAQSSVPPVQAWQPQSQGPGAVVCGNPSQGAGAAEGMEAEVIAELGRIRTTLLNFANKYAARQKQMRSTYHLRLPQCTLSDTMCVSVI